MPRRLAFLAYGRDARALADIERGLSEAGREVNILKLNRSAVLGYPLATEIERIGPQCDVAVVLLTPDESVTVSGEESAGTPGFRCRDNVILELGWFWGRLGLSRTLIIRSRHVSLPSDLQGIWHLEYDASPLEVLAEMLHWLDSMGLYRADALSTEVVSSSSSTATRDADYEFIHQQAASSLTITGIGMLNLRQRLPLLMQQARKNNLSVDIVTLSPVFARRHAKLLTTTYRPELADDIIQFHKAVKHYQGRYSDELHVRLLEYPGLLTFVATVADLGSWGSVMVVETLMPVGEHSIVERPRMLLKKRLEGGLYDRYASAVSAIIESASVNEDSRHGGP